MQAQARAMTVERHYTGHPTRLMGPAKGHGAHPCHGARRGDCDYPRCADTDKTAAPGGACRRRIHLHAECKSRNPTRSHGNSGEGVAAQYRLSAPTGRPENDVSSCLLNPELRQVARNRESSERAALFIGIGCNGQWPVTKFGRKRMAGYVPAASPDL